MCFGSVEKVTITENNNNNNNNNNEYAMLQACQHRNKKEIEN